MSTNRTEASVNLLQLCCQAEDFLGKFLQVWKQGPLPALRSSPAPSPARSGPTISAKLPCQDIVTREICRMAFRFLISSFNEESPIPPPTTPSHLQSQSPLTLFAPPNYIYRSQYVPSIDQGSRSPAVNFHAAGGKREKKTERAAQLPPCAQMRCSGLRVDYSEQLPPL